MKTVVAVAVLAMVAAGLGGCDSGNKTDDKAASAPAASAPAAAPAAEAKPAAPQDSWKDYKLGDTGLSVRVPSDPQCQDQDQGGMTNHMCSAETEKTGFMISSTKLQGEVDPAKIPAALDGAVNGQAKAMNGEVVDPKDIMVGDLKAKDYSVKTAQGEIRGRVVIKGGYLVQLMGLPKAAADDTTKAESEKFVASLSVAK